MTKKKLIQNFIFLFIITCIFSMKVFATNFIQGVEVSGATATIWFQSAVDTTWVDIHYKVNSGDQQNLRRTYNAKSEYGRQL